MGLTVTQRKGLLEEIVKRDPDPRREIRRGETTLQRNRTMVGQTGQQASTVRTGHPAAGVFRTPDSDSTDYRGRL